MSTKIHDAYITKEPMDAFSFLKVLKAKGELIRRVAEKEFISKLLIEAAGIYDQRCVGYTSSKQDKKYATGILTPLVMDRLDKAGPNPRTICESSEWKISMTAHPLEDGRWVMMFFHYYRPYDNIITEGDWLLDYSYWNNTDIPENVTAQEWERRRLDWNEVALDQTGVPSKEMFSLTMVEDYFVHVPTIADENLIPSFENRLHDLSAMVSSNYIFRYLIDRNKSINKRSATLGDYLRFTQSDTYKTILKHVKKRLEKHLIPVVRWHDLNGYYPPRPKRRVPISQIVRKHITGESHE